MKELIEKRKAWLKEIEEQDNRCTAKPIIIALQLCREYPARDGYDYDGQWEEDGEGDKFDDPIPFKEHWEDEQHFFTYSACKEHLRRNGHNYPKRRDYVKYAYRNDEWQEIPDDFKKLIDHIETLERELADRKDSGGNSQNIEVHEKPA